MKPTKALSATLLLKKVFFQCFMMAMKYLWKPSYTKQCVIRVFMDCTKDFNEKTLCSA